MPGRFLNSETRINSILADLQIADAKDLSVLGRVVAELENLAGTDTLPVALRRQAEATASFAGEVALGAVPFDTGRLKVADSVEKMGRDIVALASVGSQLKPGCDPEGGSGGQPQDREPASSPDSPEKLADDLRELVVKFGGQQKPVLEDFEAHILEFERGNPRARDAIRRTLHTWKGEFGVLGLQEYSRLIHRVEDAMESERLPTDSLLQLKDFLEVTLCSFAAGVVSADIPHEVLSAFSTPPARRDEPVAQDLLHVDDPGSGHCASDRGSRKAGDGKVDPALIRDFVAEARDHLHTAEAWLLELETEPGSIEHIHGIFRYWHSIKGVAGFLNIKEIADLAHAMETVMDGARKRELALNPCTIDLLLESNDCLRLLVNALEQSVQNGVYRVPDNYQVILRRLLEPVSEAGNGEYPGSAAAEGKIGELLVERGVVDPAAVESALEEQHDGDTRKLGQILIDSGAAPARAVAQALAGQTVARQRALVEETIRVPVGRIDHLVDTIGEAVIAQSMINAAPAIASISDQALHARIAQANLLMRQIQETAMSLRMVSIKATFQKMARLARDLAKKAGKDVEFVTEGDNTELDKSVVENIGDPLMHMVRNAVDHGVECPLERTKSGKPARARIALRAYHKAGDVVIELQDDGRGLDRVAILNKATEKKLANKDRTYSDQEVFQFIFLPGFSTAKTVTDISGRGVGMDVVRRNIHALRGSVEILSERGRGTAFTIRLPLTLAIINGMVVRLGRERYIVPTLSVLESIRPEMREVQSVVGTGEILNLRGELVRLVRLDKVLRHADQQPNSGNKIALIVEGVAGRKTGLLVDEILDQQQVVIKHLGEGLGDISGVAGGAIMSDGGVSLILDVAGIVKLAAE